MNKKTEGKILDIAAAILVSPLAAYAKAVGIKEKITASETYEKTREAAKSAGADIKNAAKKAYESEAVQKGIGAVKDTAKRVSDSEAYSKAKEGAQKGVQAARDGVKEAMSRLGFSKEDEEGSCSSEEEKEGCCEGDEKKEEESCCESNEGEYCENKEEGIEEVIDGVDLSDIITEKDANEDIPE